MTRFYYPASRAHWAYAMACDFGMEFAKRFGKWERESLVHLSGATGYKLYVHEDSVHLMEPKEHDLIQIGDDLVLWVCSNDAFWEQHKEERALKYSFIGIVQARCFFDDQQAKIIQRDGKPFFWSEQEPA